MKGDYAWLPMVMGLVYGCGLVIREPGNQITRSPTDSTVSFSGCNTIQCRISQTCTNFTLNTARKYLHRIRYIE